MSVCRPWSQLRLYLAVPWFLLAVLFRLSIHLAALIRLLLATLFMLRLGAILLAALWTVLLAALWTVLLAALLCSLNLCKDKCYRSVAFSGPLQGHVVKTAPIWHMVDRPPSGTL